MITRNKTDVVCKDLQDCAKKGQKVPFLGLVLPKDENPIKRTKFQVHRRDSCRTAGSARRHYDTGLPEMLLTVREAVVPVSKL
jgi:hypothetical protein